MKSTQVDLNAQAHSDQTEHTTASQEYATRRCVSAATSSGHARPGSCRTTDSVHMRRRASAQVFAALQGLATGLGRNAANFASRVTTCASVQLSLVTAASLLALGALAPSAAAQDVVEVPRNWALTPSGVNSGEEFRLLFITSGTEGAHSRNMFHYNHFVQGQAASGHGEIRRFSSGFRAVGSTSTVDARDNTATTFTASDKGVPIYWVNGVKVADDYEDFYDGSWDNWNAPRNERGSVYPGSSRISVNTGSNNNGTKHSDHLGAGSNVRVGRIRQSAGWSPLSAGSFQDTARPMYALSPVLRRAHIPVPSTISIISTPQDAQGYGAGEQIRVQVDFGEAIRVLRAPYIVLDVGGRARRANYASGSLSRHLVFSYTVVRGDLDADGVSLCSDTESYLVGFEAVYLRGSGTNKLVFGWEVSPRAADDSGIQLTGTPGLTHAWRPNGATVTAVSDNFPAAWTLAGWLGIANSKVDGRLLLEGGVCARTKEVRDAIVSKISAANDCSQVTEAHLAGVTGAIAVDNMTSIKVGDFAGLTSLEGLDITTTGIEMLPVGLFDDLDALTSLDIEGDFERLPHDIFRGLDTVETLELLAPPMRIDGLPDGVFEPLTSLRTVRGAGEFTKRWAPQADIGPGGTLSAGATVTLEGQVRTGPWGSNSRRTWRQFDSDGNMTNTVTLSNADTLSPTFTVPVLANQTTVRLELLAGALRTAGGTLLVTEDTAEFTILALAPTGLEVISEPVSGLGDYRNGETVEIAVLFGDVVLVDTSRGTPKLALTIGASTRQATYVRGSGTNRLLFEYTVQTSDEDTDGLSVAANSLTLQGGTITSVWGASALLGHTALATQAGHRVDGSRNNTITGGICSRTPGIRDKLLGLVRTDQSDNTLTCAQVTTAHLGALNGTLNLDGTGSAGLGGDRLTGLKRDDFAGLTGITTLVLSNNHLRDIPAGVFDPLTALTSLDLNGNNTSAGDGLTVLPAGLFDRLTGLTRLDQHGNDLSSLPPRIFEKLTLLGTNGLLLDNNPGSARFVPIARAGEDLEVASGATARLGVDGAEDGFDDPWGSNIESWSWEQTAGTTVTFTAGKGPDTARPEFIAGPTSETLRFRLTVTGRGSRTSAADTVNVEVTGAPHVEGVSFVGTPRAMSGANRTYGLGEWIEVGLRFDRPVQVNTTLGRPSTFLEVGSRRNATAAYRRGSGTSELVFGYRVQRADRDTNGVALVANSLRLSGGSIIAVSNAAPAVLTHAGLAGGSDRAVDGSIVPEGVGVCDRSPAVAAAIVAKLASREVCSDVTEADLPTVTGRLDVSAQVDAHGRMTALRTGDFAGLTGVTALDLDNHAIRLVPASVFDPLTALTSLSLAYNQTQAADRMRTLPAGVFDALTGLNELRLEQNDLETLPDNIFEKLVNLRTLTLNGNPGSARFVPNATAGPEGGVDVEAPRTPLTLGGDGDGDPWGSNVTYAWRKVEGPFAELSAANVARPTLTPPTRGIADELIYEVEVTGRGTRLSTRDRVTIRLAVAPTITRVVIISVPADGGNHYHAGETIEIATDFSVPVLVEGTPQFPIEIGTATKHASYARGSGTQRLVFAYTVQATDERDDDGVNPLGPSLNLDGGSIRDANGFDALIALPRLGNQTGHGVDASTAGLTGGICSRTGLIRDKLVELVRTDQSDDTLTCATVTDTHLGALMGELNLNAGPLGELGGNSLRQIGATDFAGLTGITRLRLAHNQLGSIPAGAFDSMTALIRLNLEDNALTTLPAGLFDQLTGLTHLELHINNLSSLPPRIFERLTNLTTLSLNRNPGSARFVPTARAGEDLEVARNETATVGVEGAAAGFDDPWGNNVTWSWTQTMGSAVTYASGKGADTARPEFTAPDADETVAFTLSVTGKGSIALDDSNQHTATDTVTVGVGATGIEPMPTSATVDGATLTLTYDETLATTSPTSAAGKGSIYLAVVRNPGVRRSVTTARGTAPRASGSTVTMTLNPPVEYGQQVTLSYHPDNATQNSRVQDSAGNVANAFAGFAVDNRTPEPAHIDGVAFASNAQTHAIGDTIAMDVTFSEAVTVSGTPMLELEIGTETRKARYVSGSRSTVLRFEYTVAEGDLDTVGATIAANGLETPTGSSITTTAASETVNLSHGSLRDANQQVDGIRPTPTSASVTGPALTMTWSEALMPDAATIRPDAFTVRINGTAEPALRAAASDPIDRRRLTLTLARSIAPGTTGITVDYEPGTAPVEDFAGNPAGTVTGQTVALQTATNSPASGRLTVSGTARVGQTLTATLSDLADPDGLAASPIYEFTWYRVDGTSEEVITTTRNDLPRSRHLLTAADAGKKVRVTATFDDHVGNSETIESDNFPSFGSIAWNTQASCAMPDLTGRELVWTGLLTVGTFTSGGNVTYGYGTDFTGSTLSDTTFTLGTTGYTVEAVGTIFEGLQFRTTANLPRTATNALRLHVCDSALDFSDASYVSTNRIYSWTSTGLDWSTTSTRRLYLSQADETAPVLQTIEIDAATATLTYDEALKATNPTPASAFTIGVTGGGTLTASDVRAGVGTHANQVTLALDPPADYGQTLTMAYAASSATVASKIQDLGGNAAPGFTQAPVPVRNTTPQGPHVDAVAFAGNPGTSKIGDVIDVDVTFSEAVTVTGRPRLMLEIGSENVWASWKRGQSSRTVHRFEYTITEGNLDTDGARIQANTLEAPSGSTVRTTAASESVRLTHGSRLDPTRLVDGVRPTVRPEREAIRVAGPTVTVVWTEPLDENSVPSGTGGFRVRIANATDPAVRQVALSGAVMTLTLSSAIADGTQNVTLDYTPPAGTKIQDAVGNPAIAFSARDVTVTPDTRSPEVTAASIDGATLVLTFDEPLSGTTAPAAFNVLVTRNGATVSGYSVDSMSLDSAGTMLTLTLNQAVRSGDDVSLGYNPPGVDPLQDRAATPNAVGTFLTGDSAPGIDNTTPGVRTVTFAGTAATLKIDDKVAIEAVFSEAVRVTTSSTARPQVGVLIGTETRQARYVSGTGGATLRFEYTIADGDEDTDGIEIAADALNVPSGSSIRTQSGNRTVEFAHDAVTADAARTVDGVRPSVAETGAVDIAGPTVTVTWSEPLDEGAVPSGAGGFRVQIAGSSGPAVTQVAITGSVATLTLDSAIADGTENVTLDYTPPSGNKIQDVNGNTAAAFSGKEATVTPDTRAPQVTAASIDGAGLTITFDEPLQGTTIAVNPFTVRVIRSGSTISGYTVSTAAIDSAGTMLTLTLNQAVRAGDDVTLGYVPPISNPLRDRATPANTVSEFQTGINAPPVDNVTPSVDTLTFAGTPETLGIGDRVEIDAVFTQVVTVRTSSTARPQIGVLIGTETRQARYVSGTGSATLRFEYTVAEGDEDTDGIEIAANALTVPSGSSIRTQTDNRTVQLAHDAVAADTARTVDGIRPTVNSAAVEGPTLTVTWSEALDEDSAPTGAGGMTIRIGNANGPAVTSVSVTGSTTVLTLASAIADGTANVTLEYDASRASPPVRDAAGNAAASIPRAEAKPVQVGEDMRPPELAEAPRVDGAILKLTFDEWLDPNSIPAPPGGFSVTVTRDNAPVPNVTVTALALDSAGTGLSLTLSEGVRGGDSVVLGYAPPSTDPLRDRATTPNAVAAFMTGTNNVPEVDNATPSVSTVAFAGAAEALAIGGKVVIEAVFTEAVAVTTSGSARPQVAVAVGTETRQARYVSGANSTTLRFEYTVAEGDTDTDGIEIAANALSVPSGSSIRTQAGNRTVQLGHDAVAADAARTVDGTRPQAQGAEAEGQTVIVRWSEAIDEASARNDAGGFVLRYGGLERPAVTAVAVDGTDNTKVRLTIDAAIPDGTQGVTLAWTVPSSGVPIRDVAGNTGVAFSDDADRLAVSVTPDTAVPTLMSATIHGRVLALTFSEPLDEGSVPATGQFTITVQRDGNSVAGHTTDAVEVVGAVVTLTLAIGVLPDDTVTVAYVKPAQNMLRDRAVTPNEAEAFTTGAGTAPAVDNRTAALEVTLSNTASTEGDGEPLTLTVSEAGASAVERTITVTASGTALETEDWTLESKSLNLAQGAQSVEFPITVIDNARLEHEESVTFTVSADGATIGNVTLTITDNDRGVLNVVAPEGGATEGAVPFTLALRLDPHPVNGANPSADECFLDFPVTAELSAAGDVDELSATPTLPREVSFPATTFDDCTREVTVEFETRASDEEWEAPRTVVFSLSPAENQDERIGAGNTEVRIIDDTPPPGPLATRVWIDPTPPGATDDYRPSRTREQFKEVADEAVHGPGTTITFTVTFDHAVTIEPNEENDALPELVLDVGGRERRATLSGSQENTQSLIFRWTVDRGDYDPDGIAIRRIDPQGARIRFGAGCQMSGGVELPCDFDTDTFVREHSKAHREHRVRGGFFTMGLDTSAMEGTAREAERPERRTRHACGEGTVGRADTRESAEPRARPNERRRQSEHMGY